ncbi:4a-hydroxytetrahydrobiopterin dehydratase [Pseudonocardia humida]|uniref:Putative pterin-4-alpha-carbinolamine dehydratase n=1 Tax=Pseudonocardia humida TaxID=2800819 RepID=A0ABT1A3K3_9PSEU|nr:4a-hydroxytetrahydrobiopterin dehydratase [Pseudonocardia humida]MCO1657581.1 4a-hydroxytetrahydrobiopterin dehydratase [Pseudonocardia humida]
MADLLDDAAVSAALHDLPDWERDGDALVRRAELPSFPKAIEVVGRVGAFAEQRDHHPDIDIRWRTLTFRCSTHSAGGLTQLDVVLAKAIEDEISSAGG